MDEIITLPENCPGLKETHIFTTIEMCGCRIEFDGPLRIRDSIIKLLIKEQLDH